MNSNQSAIIVLLPILDIYELPVSFQIVASDASTLRIVNEY